MNRGDRRYDAGFMLMTCGELWLQAENSFISGPRMKSYKDLQTLQTSSVLDRPYWHISFRIEFFILVESSWGKKMRMALIPLGLGRLRPWFLNSTWCLMSEVLFLLTEFHPKSEFSHKASCCTCVAHLAPESPGRCLLVLCWSLWTVWASERPEDNSQMQKFEKGVPQRQDHPNVQRKGLCLSWLKRWWIGAGERPQYKTSSTIPEKLERPFPRLYSWSMQHWTDSKKLGCKIHT